MTTTAGQAGGFLVEVDDSLCIVLRQPRCNGDDILLTVTDVAGLVWALECAVSVRDGLERAL